MMRSLFILKLFIFSGLIYAQDPSQTFRFGLNGSSSQNYALARLAFERLLFFEQDSFALESMKQLGLISMEEGKLQEAISWFGRASSVSVREDERAWCDLQQAAAYLRLKDSKMGLMILLGLPDTLTKPMQGYSEFLKGVAWFIEQNFTESQLAFKRAADTEDQKMQLDSLFNQLAKIKHPKPHLARIFSILLPGAGQFYAGDFRNGLNSLLLTGGFLALGIYSLLYFTPFDAIVTIAPWFQRYYMGGYKRAALIAADRLNEKQNRVYLQILACFPD